MVVTLRSTQEVAEVLVSAISEVDVRVEWYVSDRSRPPVVVIGQPTIDWKDPDSGFCWASWDFPLLVVTARNGDREAQTELSRLVCEIAKALDRFDLSGSGVFSIEPVDARPASAQIGGQELPAYQLRVQVRA